MSLFSYNFHGPHMYMDVGNGNTLRPYVSGYLNVSVAGLETRTILNPYPDNHGTVVQFNFTPEIPEDGEHNPETHNLRFVFNETLLGKQYQEVVFRQPGDTLIIVTGYDGNGIYWNILHSRGVQFVLPTPES